MTMSQVKLKLTGCESQGVIVTEKSIFRSVQHNQIEHSLSFQKYIECPELMSTC